MLAPRDSQVCVQEGTKGDLLLWNHRNIGLSDSIVMIHCYFSFFSDLLYVYFHYQLRFLLTYLNLQ